MQGGQKIGAGTAEKLIPRSSGAGHGCARASVRAALVQHVRPGAAGSRGYAARCVARRRPPSVLPSVLRARFGPRWLTAASRGRRRPTSRPWCALCRPACTQAVLPLPLLQGHRCVERGCTGRELWPRAGARIISRVHRQRLEWERGVGGTGVGRERERVREEARDPEKGR